MIRYYVNYTNEVPDELYDCIKNDEDFKNLTEVEQQEYAKQYFMWYIVDYGMNVQIDCLSVFDNLSDAEKFFNENKKCYEYLELEKVTLNSDGEEEDFEVIKYFFDV